MLPKVGRKYIMTEDGIIHPAQKVNITYGLNDKNCKGFSKTFDLPEVSVKTYSYRIENEQKDFEILEKDDVIEIVPKILSKLFMRIQ
jgi:hypothetical protein